MSIRTRVVTYALEEGPTFLDKVTITVSEGVVLIEVLKREGIVYAAANIEAEAFKTDAQFLIEEIEGA